MKHLNVYKLMLIIKFFIIKHSLSNKLFYTLIVSFQSIVSGFLIDFPQDVRNCADAIVGARFVLFYELYEEPVSLAVPLHHRTHFQSPIYD